MKYLLDTHTFIWWDTEPDKLSQRIFRLFHDRSNTLLLSVASIWEMQIKLQLGKLTFHLPLTEVIESQQATNGLEVLPINLVHIVGLESLPHYQDHKDPFDRMLIAQAKVEDAVLVSKDSNFSRYSVRLDW